jgi:uncharacterized protein
MQFVVIAYDYKEGGLEKRMKVRPDHLRISDAFKQKGKYLYGVGITNEKDELVGSVMVFDVKDRKELDDYLKTEPYVTGNVWEKVIIHPCRVGPSFMPGGLSGLAEPRGERARQKEDKEVT